MESRQPRTVIKVGLKSLIEGAIESYLTIDNPEGKKNNLFAASGPKGRERAIKYREKISDINDNNTLASVIYADLSEGGVLASGKIGSSKVFRNRIMDALCEYYNISKEDINSETERYSKIAAPVGGMGGTGLTSNNQMRSIAIMKLLEKKVDPKNHKSPIFNIGYSDKDSSY